MKMIKYIIGLMLVCGAVCRGDIAISGPASYKQQKIIVIQGDSISERILPEGDSGYGRTNWMYHAPLTNGFFKAAKVYNFAFGGMKASEIANNYSGNQVSGGSPDYIAYHGGHAVKPSSAQDGYYFCMLGVNDIGASSSASDIYTDLTNAWFAARLDGYKVVAFTITPVYGYIGTSKDVEIADLNALIWGDTTKYDYLVYSSSAIPKQSVSASDWMSPTDTHPSPSGSYKLSLAIQRVMSGNDSAASAQYDGIGNYTPVLSAFNSKGYNNYFHPLGGVYLAGNATNSNIYSILQAYSSSGAGKILAVNPYGGKLAVGKLVPLSDLDVKGDVWGNSVASIAGIGSFNTSGGVLLAGYAGSSYAAVRAYSDAAGTGKTLIINGLGGNVGVGTGTSANSILQVNGAIATPVTVGGSVTLGLNNSTYIVNVGAQTVTLPTATTCIGRTYIIKVISPATSATVATTSSQTIDGATTYSLSAANKYVVVQSDGANWYVIGNN